MPFAIIHLTAKSNPCVYYACNHQTIHTNNRQKYKFLPKTVFTSRIICHLCIWLVVFFSNGRWQWMLNSTNHRTKPIAIYLSLFHSFHVVFFATTTSSHHRNRRHLLFLCVLHCLHFPYPFYILPPIFLFYHNSILVRLLFELSLWHRITK